MTREEREQAIAILENEKKCVNRANKNDYCNRDCYNCELVKTDTEILTALDMAIQALKQEPIVRCGQCKYAEVADSEDSQDGYTCQFHRGSIWFSGSYCSWAERRQDG